MTLQEKLITLRKQKGLSQDALADKLYVSRQAVYKWETGQSIPDIEKLRVLSSMYNVSIDNLLNDKEGIRYATDVKAPITYGKVIRKKELKGDEADVHNLKLLPDEQKQADARKKALKTLDTWNWVFIGLALFFTFGGALGLALIFIAIAIIVCPIIKSSLKKKYPDVRFNRTYYHQEHAKAEALLKSKFDTVIQLQNDLLAWFVYSHKDKVFGIYYDGDYQFLCPISNFAKFEITTYNGLAFYVTIKYFGDDGSKLCDYKLDLTCFRKYDVEETLSGKEHKLRQFNRSNGTKYVLNEIKSKLEIEKARF